MAEIITMGADGTLHVPDEPIIPFIEGDGTGVDIWPAAQQSSTRRWRSLRRQAQIAWKEVFAGEKAFNELGDWLPDETLEALRDTCRHQGAADDAGRRRHPLAQRGPAPDARPLRLPAAGALLRGRAVAGQGPEKLNMVIFRENTEDVYAGIE